MIKALIWDLDGTLIHSYEAITNSLYHLTKELNIHTSKETIYHDILKSSVNEYLNNLEKITFYPLEKMKQRYDQLMDELSESIRLMHHAKEILKETSKIGIQHFMYTHKGISTFDLLEKLGIGCYFTEILTNASGFQRKPHPEAIDYLVEKYHLDRNKTYYVGDRKLDIECAMNAHIHSILYLYEKGVVEPIGNEDVVIEDLIEILEVC